MEINISSGSPVRTPKAPDPAFGRELRKQPRSPELGASWNNWPGPDNSLKPKPLRGSVFDTDDLGRAPRAHAFETLTIRPSQPGSPGPLHSGTCYVSDCYVPGLGVQGMRAL